jgi:hypothetical protein
MSQTQESVLNSTVVRDVKEEIESRFFEINKVKVCLKVLSVHLGSSTNVIVLRLAIRPATGTEIVVVNNSSLESRLFEVGITSPFTLDESRYTEQIDQLVKQVQEDAIRVLDRSSPRVVVKYVFPLRMDIFILLCLLTLVSVGIVLWIRFYDPRTYIIVGIQIVTSIIVVVLSRKWVREVGVHQEQSEHRERKLPPTK